VQRDDIERRRTQRDQGVGDLKQASAARSEDQFRWTEQPSVQQTRLNRKGKDEHDREDDEAQAGPDSSNC
jgi:hypothetical protein